MQAPEKIIQCYDLTAKVYSEKFFDELSKKHFDQFLLRAFTAENKGNGKCIDLGCGPGQIAKFLHENGMQDIMGIDISPEMIKQASQLNPSIKFETADMLNLHFTDSSFASAVAFYSLIHFDYEQLTTALYEVKRVLTNGAQFLFSFHLGGKIIHLENFLDHKVDLYTNFFDTEKVIEVLTKTGFTLIDVMERLPYTGVEYPSKRAYIWVENRK